MSKNDRLIQSLGTQTRREIFNGYCNYGSEFGIKLARRYVFDVAEAVSEIHGRDSAAAMLYELADKTVGRMPLADFRDFVVPKQTGKTVAKLGWRFRVSAIFGRNVEPLVRAAFWNGVGFGAIAAMVWGAIWR